MLAVAADEIDQLMAWGFVGRLCEGTGPWLVCLRKKEVKLERKFGAGLTQAWRRGKALGEAGSALMANVDTAVANRLVVTFWRGGALTVIGGDHCQRGSILGNWRCIASNLIPPILGRSEAGEPAKRQNHDQ